MPFGWRVPPGRTSDAGKPSPLHFRCFRPCGPSIRPPRSPAGRSERASVETQRLVFACVHETPDSARLQAGIRGTRAFGGLPPRRLLSFHTSKPNRRVSRSPVHSGRSRPSRLRRGGSTTRTLRGIAAARHPARSSRLSDGRTAAASRIRDGRPKAAFTARPPDPGTVKHSDGFLYTGSQATAVTATHGPRYALRRPRARAMPFGWRVPLGRDIGRRQAVAASLPMLRPCGPSIRPPRSPAGRSERASVETQRLAFACVHETPDSARIQSGIRGPRAFGGIPPRRLLSFHTSKPNRRVSRSSVNSGRSRPSRLRRGGGYAAPCGARLGLAASRHPARSSRLSDGRTAAASRIRDGRPKAAFTARPPDPGTVKHSDGFRNTDSQATAVTATHGPRPPRYAARVRGPCRSDGACRWGTAFGRRQAVAASLPNANAPAALPSVRHGHRLGAPNTHP